jgi:hypothetical protein
MASPSSEEEAAVIRVFRGFWLSSSKTKCGGAREGSRSARYDAKFVA